jgi:hypothetical protein
MERMKEKEEELLKRKERENLDLQDIVEKERLLIEKEEEIEEESLVATEKERMKKEKERWAVEKERRKVEKEKLQKESRIENIKKQESELQKIHERREMLLAEIDEIEILISERREQVTSPTPRVTPKRRPHNNSFVKSKNVQQKEVKKDEASKEEEERKFLTSLDFSLPREEVLKEIINSFDEKQKRLNLSKKLSDIDFRF